MSLTKTEPQRRCCDAPMHEFQDTARGWVAWCETCGRVAWWLGGGKTRQMQPSVHPELREAVARAMIVGTQMSNFCFNRSQPAYGLEDDVRSGLKRMQLEWDSASDLLRGLLKRGR